MSLFRAKKGASLSGEAAVALFVKAKRERVLKVVPRKAGAFGLKRSAEALSLSAAFA